ncbi:protein YIPF1 [Teleopsis dalmanni]|uniref:protein YIPF1 n=1 Tax=Teleopsis dalmanni TaxID=139649 RepID=UPI0018CD9FB0|nr:protein YIPF1 [Teleopsis dalmanni]
MQLNSMNDLLQFKDFSDSPNISPLPVEININSPTFSLGAENNCARDNQLSDLRYDMEVVVNMNNNADVLIEDRNCSSEKLSFLSIECYQQFFNVDMYMVLERIVNSIIPQRADITYLRSNIGRNPDMYGPFWIAVTLIFSIGISGNIASYLQHINDNFQWHYNFHLVSYAASCIFLYANLVPATLWAIFKYGLKPVEKGLQTENAYPDHRCPAAVHKSTFQCFLKGSNA